MSDSLPKLPQKPKATSTLQKPKATSTLQKPKLKKSKKVSSSLIEDAKQSSKRKWGKKEFFSFLLLVVCILISVFCSFDSGLSGMLLQFFKSQSETKNYLSVATTFSPAKEETTPNSLDVFKLRVKYNEPHYSTCTLQLINQSKEEITCKLLYVKNSQRYTDVVTIPAFGNKEIKYINHVIYGSYKQKVPIHAVAALKVEVDGLNEEHVYKLVHVSQVAKP